MTKGEVFQKQVKRKGQSYGNSAIWTPDLFLIEKYDQG